MSELEALRAYFDAHMAMSAAIDADKFAAAAAKANQARDRLVQSQPICAKPDLMTCDCIGVCKRAAA